MKETNIKNDQYNLYNNTIPLTEEYTGINGVRYKHVYYLAEVKDKSVNYILMKKIKINIQK